MSIHFPTREQWDILKEFLEDPGAVIVAPDVEETLTEEEKEALKEASDGYDFGGDADVWLDVVYDRDHMFIRDTLNNINNDDDDDE